MVRCLVAAAFAVGLMAHSEATVVAQSRADKAKAKRLFIQGNRAFKQGRYSDALASYRASFTLVERPRTMFNIAVCRDRLADLEGAYVDYDRFLSIAQKRDAKLAAKATARVTELKNTLEIEVSVTSSPPGASVFAVESGVKTMLGRTPATVKLRMGQHQLRVEAPEHRSSDVTAEVVAGKPNRVDVTLEAMARITITTTPEQAAISMVGATTSATGRFAVVTEPGVHRFEISHDGYVSQTLAVKAVGRDIIHRHVTLEKKQAVRPPPPPKPVAPRRVYDEVNVPDRGLWWRRAGIGLAGLALGSVALGISQGLSARDQSDKAQAAADMGQWDRGAFNAAERHQRRMLIFYGVGGAALVGGGLLYYVGYKRRGRLEIRPLGIAITPTAGGFAAHGRF